MSNSVGEILSNHIGLRHGFQFRETDFTESGIQVIKIGNVTDNGLNLEADVSFVSEDRISEFESIVIKDGDILMSLTGNIGRVVEVKGLNGKVLFQNYRVGVFYPLDDKVYKPFIKWIFSSENLLRQLSNHSNQSAQANFGKQDLDKLRFNLPEFLHQQRIAKILSTADAVIEKTQAAIAKYKAIKQGMLQDLFTRGIDLQTGKLRPRYEDAPELYKESKLGWIPREWNCDSIDNLTDKVGSGVTPTGGSEVYKSQGILFLRSQNILYGKLSLNDVAFIPKEIDEIMENSRVKPFDVLLNITGASIGRCAFFPEDLASANVNQHVCIIRFKKPSKSLAVFASEYLNTDFGQRQMYKAMAVGNREGLNYQQIKAFNFPEIKNPNELEKISSIIESTNNKLQTEEAYLQKMQSLKKGLMEDLLSGRKRVKVAEELITQNDN